MPTFSLDSLLKVADTNNANKILSQVSTSASKRCLLTNKASSSTHDQSVIIACPHPECDYKDKSRRKVSTHLSLHGDPRPFHCTQCPSKFKDSSALSGHTRQIHSNARPYKCQRKDCNYSAKLLKGLKSHLKTHDQLKNILCPHCDHKCLRKSALKVHLNTHMLGKKSFECKLCDYSAGSSSGLNRHVRIHTGERPYPCSMCDFSAKTKQDLDSHFANKHE